MPGSVKRFPLQSNPRSILASLNALLEPLHGVRRTTGGWMARCPAHDDRSPSLSITERQGFNTENRTEQVNGERHSWFRLSKSRRVETIVAEKPKESDCAPIVRNAAVTP